MARASRSKRCRRSGLSEGAVSKYFDRHHTIQPAVSGFVDFSHSSCAERTQNVIRTKLLSEQRWRLVLHYFRDLLHRRLPQKAPCFLVHGQQRFHFAAQARIPLAGLFKERRTLFLRNFQRRVVQPINLFPTIRSHEMSPGEALQRTQIRNNNGKSPGIVTRQEATGKQFFGQFLTKLDRRSADLAFSGSAVFSPEVCSGFSWCVAGEPLALKPQTHTDVGLHYSKILQHPSIRLKNDDFDGGIPAVRGGNGKPKIKPWTWSPLPEYVGLPIQARKDRALSSGAPAVYR